MRIYSSVPRQFTEADAYFASAAANFGAIALESAKFYQSLQKTYDVFREELLQWNAYLGYEWTSEETVVPPKEEVPLTSTGTGTNS
jgi:hypothetical protein